MKSAVLGTGNVGTTIASKLIERGHEVRMGARSATNEKAAAWAQKSGERASHGSFADAAAFGEMAFVCTKGEGTVDAVRAAGDANLRGKVLVDVSNPLDFSKGFPPTNFTPGDDSLGERVQREVPEARVVKALNTVNCEVMVDASRVGGPSDIFVCGNDADAKAAVSKLLREDFGWQSVVDLGDLTTARGTEAYLLLWVRLYGVMKTGDFNVRLVKKG